MLEELLTNPKEILKKQPFYRGCSELDLVLDIAPEIVGTSYSVELPERRSQIVTQDRFMQELDPMCHQVHFDETIPDIAVKKSAKSGNFVLRQKGIRVAFNYQEIIADKRTQYLCGNPMRFTLCNLRPSEAQKEHYLEIKEQWINKNMDVWKYKLVRSQMRTGDGAILHYIKTDPSGKKIYKSRLLSYEDGYTLLPHYDDSGDLVLFGVFYRYKNKERLDIYDSKMFYRLENNIDTGWVLTSDPVPHGFLEIPITYKRKDPAWNKVQNNIDVYEVLYNIYTVVQKRFGSSILWVKGNYDAKTRKQGWALVLNASSLDANADAKILSPAEPTGMQNLLADMKKQIQMGSHTVILQPDDIKIAGDLSGVAVKMLLSSAYEHATQEALEYDDAADSMLRLFTYGIGIEKSKTVEYSNLIMRAEFEAWTPQSDTDVINNINNSVSQGSLSVKTAAEIHPYASPDEASRIEQERAAQAKDEIDAKQDKNIEPPKNN